MKLSNYMSGILSKFKDSRVTKNTKELIENVIEHKSIRVWTISKDKAEYDRSKRLLDSNSRFGKAGMLRIGQQQNHQL